MSKQKPNKIKPAEAMKVLANEMQQMRVIINGLMQENLNFKNNLQDMATVFDAYITFKGDDKEFIKHLDKLIAKQKEESNDDKRDEPTDGKDTEGDKVDKGVGAEGVRTQ
tara:strand:+ start:2216 stop:2545 length:330 start_codon:yes stop_codon:yes gene_type:complete